MKLFIEREGSTWGGAVGCYVVNLNGDKAKLAIVDNFDEMQITHAESKEIKYRLIKNQVRIANCNRELNVRTSYLNNLMIEPLNKVPSVIFDTQIDYIYAVDGDDIRLIYVTGRNINVQPEDNFTCTAIKSIMRAISELDDEDIDWSRFTVIGECTDEVAAQAIKFALTGSGKSVTTGSKSDCTSLCMQSPK